MRDARLREPAGAASVGAGLTDEWFARAVRGKFYRPVKEIVSIRLDKDVLAFYRSQGAGYQTRINDTLRAAMQAAILARRKAQR